MGDFGDSSFAAVPAASAVSFAYDDPFGDVPAAPANAVVFSSAFTDEELQVSPEKQLASGAHAAEEDMTHSDALEARACFEHVHI